MFRSRLQHQPNKTAAVTGAALAAAAAVSSSSSTTTTTTATLIESLRTMRFPPSNKKTNNAQPHKKPLLQMAQLSSVCEPLKLDDDFTPFPLPRYDESTGLEPTFVRGSVDGERVLQRQRTKQQGKQTQSLKMQEAAPDIASPLETVSDIVEALDAAAEEAARDSKNKTAALAAASASALFEGAPQSEGTLAPSRMYVREPTHSSPALDAVIERQLCLRPIMPDLVAQLTDNDSPNFERNVAALSDIKATLEDYLVQATTVAGAEQQRLLELDDARAAADEEGEDEHDEHIQLIRRVQKFKRARDQSILSDFSSACAAVKSIFFGASRALFLAKFEDMRHVTSKGFRRDGSSQQIFFDFFHVAERFVVEIAIPELCQIAAEQRMNRNSSRLRGAEEQEGQQQQLQKRTDELISAITEYLGIIAHFQTLDHRRHYDRDEYNTSGRLLPTHASTNIGKLEYATGNDCLAALAESFNALSGVVPTAVLAQWMLHYGSSFTRTLGDMQTHALLRQKLAEELVLGRLLPACREASRWREERPFALFEDDTATADGGGGVTLLLEEVSGSSRGRVIGNILLACAMADVTLPKDFLVEGLIQPALEYSKTLLQQQQQQRQQQDKKSPSAGDAAAPFLHPNFFCAMARLTAGPGMPVSKLFPLAKLQFELFCTRQEQKRQENENETTTTASSGERHDWYNALFDLAFSSHDRSAAIDFLRSDVRLGASLLSHMRDFAYDLESQRIEDETENTQGVHDALPPEMTQRRYAMARGRSAGTETDELFVTEGGSYAATVGERDASGNNANEEEEEEDDDDDESNINSSSSSSGGGAKLTHNELSALPTLLSPAAAAGTAPSTGNLDYSFFDTNACHKIAASRTAYILHPSLLRGPSLDGLREIIERCREQSACLVVPSSCLYHLAEPTADTASACGRRPHRGIKRRAVRAIFEELRADTKTVLVSPEEEVAIRHHDGFAYADSIVWELRGWIASRAPTTRIVVACAEDHRVRHRFQIFRRGILATEQLDAELHHHGGEDGDAGAQTAELAAQQQQQDALLFTQEEINSHPLLRLAHGDNADHAARGVPGATRTGKDLDNFSVQGLLDRIQERYVSPRRIRDPIENRKFQPGLWSAGNRSDRGYQMAGNMENYTYDVKAMGKNRRLKGRSFGAIHDDWRGVGVFMPDHQEGIGAQ